MQVQRIQNNNPQFQGILKVQNFKKGGKVIERETGIEFDRDLANIALKNIFDGSWKNDGKKEISGENITKYLNILRQTMGISVSRNAKKAEQVELKNLGTGYSIKSDGEYKITHFRDDMVWE
jgi:hypothetical protein